VTKLVLTQQHLDADGPANLAKWLRQRGLPATDAQACFGLPQHSLGWVARVVLGG
jgi:hypothetical protein